MVFMLTDTRGCFIAWTLLKIWRCAYASGFATHGHRVSGPCKLRLISRIVQNHIPKYTVYLHFFSREIPKYTVYIYGSGHTYFLKKGGKGVSARSNDSEELNSTGILFPSPVLYF